MQKALQYNSLEAPAPFKFVLRKQLPLRAKSKEGYSGAPGAPMQPTIVTIPMSPSLEQAARIGQDAVTL